LVGLPVSKNTFLHLYLLLQEEEEKFAPLNSRMGYMNY